MPYRRSYEQQLAALDAILDDWCAAPYKTDELRQKAIEAVRALGYKECDAVRWVASAGRRPVKAKVP